MMVNLLFQMFDSSIEDAVDSKISTREHHVLFCDVIAKASARIRSATFQFIFLAELNFFNT